MPDDQFQDDSKTQDDAYLNSGQNQEGESLIKPLPEDHDTPFSPPTDPIQDASADLDNRIVQGQLDSTHQALDPASDIDDHQIYDEGLAGAAEASEPNAGNAVVGYDPDKDQRRNAATTS